MGGLPHGHLVRIARGRIDNDIHSSRPGELIHRLTYAHDLAGIHILGRNESIVVRRERVIAQRVLCHGELGRGLIARGERGGVRILRLLQLIGGDQLVRELLLVPIELPARVAQPMRGGGERRPRTRHLPQLVSRIELREHLARGDPIAEPHAPFDHFSRHPERERIRIARRDLGGVARGIRVLCDVNGVGDDRDGGRRCRRAGVARGQ